MAWKIEIPYDRNSPYNCEDTSDAVQVIIESDAYLDSYEIGRNEFDEYIDEAYGDIDVCGIDYSPSEVLKNVDECRYDEWYQEECSERARESGDEIENELENNEYEGGSVWFAGNITATYYEAEEEEDDEGHDVEEFDDLLAM